LASERVSSLKPSTRDAQQAKIMPDILSSPVRAVGHSHSAKRRHHHFDRREHGEPVVVQENCWCGRKTISTKRLTQAAIISTVKLYRAAEEMAF
jgi:hypothetical protein